MIVFLLAAWLCSAIRAAVLTSERTRVARLAHEGDTRAEALLKLLENPYRSLSPINFFFGAMLVGMGLALAWYVWETNPEWLPRLTHVLGFLLLFVFGKFLFDYVAISRASVIALASARPLTWLFWLSTPLLNFNTWLVRLAKGPRVRSRPSERISSDDIQIIMAEGEEPRKIELIDPDEREMIAGIIEMGQRSASEIMIPRLDVVALEVNCSIEDALDIAIQHGHSRLPVYEEDIDHVVGILHVKDLLQVLRRPEPNLTLRKLLRPVHYVPETAKADDILRDLLRNRVHMAVVVDEYGGTAGVLTIEDVIEEIVGEIRDEYDIAEEAPFTLINENEALFNGRVPIAEVNQVLKVELPMADTDSLGGLIYATLGRLPKQGETVRAGPLELTVTALDGHRIKQVRAVKVEATPEPSADRQVGDIQDGQEDQPTQVAQAGGAST